MSFDADPRAVWARYAQARKALEKVAASFGRQGIDVLAVKGVVTSEWLYADRSERPLGDVDVRIRPGAFRPALRAAEREGWPIDRRVWSYRSFIVRVDGMWVDVESSWGPPSVSALSVATALSRATRAHDGSWVPDIHDHAVLLTVNVFKDKMMAAAAWALEDTYRVVSAKGFDVEAFVSRVREARVEALAWLVADWMFKRRGSVAWRIVRALLGGDAPLRARYVALMQKLWARERPEATALRLLSRAASDDPWRRVLALALSAGWEAESHRPLRGRACL